MTQPTVNDIDISDDDVTDEIKTLQAAQSNIDIVFTVGYEVNALSTADFREHVISKKATKRNSVKPGLLRSLILRQHHILKFSTIIKFVSQNRWESSITSLLWRISVLSMSILRNYLMDKAFMK